MRASSYDAARSPDGAEAGELHQPVGPRVALEEREQLRRRRALVVGRRGVVDEAAGGLAQIVDALREVGPPADLERELAPGRAQRLVDAREHPAQAVGAVGREQAQPVGIAVGAELVERLPERLAPEHRALRVVELAEARIEPGGERIGLQEPQAEAVDGRDPGAVELAREVVAPALGERGADARAQLAGRAPRVRDDEDRVDVEPALADRAHEALDEHRRLAGARAGGDEDLAASPRPLRAAARSCALGTRHIGQRSHHVGHSPPFGSCTTSPPRIRCRACARSRARGRPRPRTPPPRGSRSANSP